MHISEITCPFCSGVNKIVELAENLAVCKGCAAGFKSIGNVQHDFKNNTDSYDIVTGDGRIVRQYTHSVHDYCACSDHFYEDCPELVEDSSEVRYDGEQLPGLTPEARRAIYGK